MRSAIIAFFLVFVTALPSLAEKRVALVIGNGKYDTAAPLPNPANDANDIAAKLEKLNFDVVRGVDLDHAGMRDTVKAFSQKLEGADVALFFYAGHAVQVNGQNYLAPVDTDLERESDLDFETISLSLVRKQMEREATTNIVLLDACRNNPLSRQLFASSRSANDSQGLARLDTTAEGTFIAFATQPDNVALDGDDRNSPFTKALLRHIDRPGVEISAMMTDVRREVYDSTNQQQLPWTNSSLLGHFYFNDAPAGTDGSSDPVVTERDRKLQELSREADAWDAVRETKDPAAIRAFIDEFPNGTYAELAQFTLERLTGDSGTQKTIETAALDTGEQDARQEKLSPEAEEPDREAIRSIQAELGRIGCDAGRPDGIWGRNSRAALSNFAKHASVDLPTLEPTFSLLDQLEKQDGRVCPLVCKVTEIERDGQCHRKTCASGQQLNSRGECITQTVRKSAPSQPRATQPVKRNTGACFRFNGQLLCD